MKKVFSLAAAMVLALCMSVGAFAAGSVSGVVVSATGGVAMNGTTQPLSVADAIKAVKVSNVASATALETFDLTGTPGDVTFILTITPDANTRVLHHENGQWNDVTKGFDAAAKTVTGAFTSFSPVAIVQVTTVSAKGGTKDTGKLHLAWSDGGVVVDEGGGKILMRANPGYAVRDVLVDGASVGAVSEYTFTDTHVNHALMAYFASLDTKSRLSPKTGWRDLAALAGGLGAIGSLGVLVIFRKKDF